MVRVKPFEQIVEYSVGKKILFLFSPGGRKSAGSRWIGRNDVSHR